jgi:uncharacterized membrane protein
MKLKITELITVMLAALVMGVFWGTWFTLTRSIHDFSAAEFIHIGKNIIANVAIPMRVLMPLTILMMMFASWQTRKKYKAANIFYNLSLVFMIITLIITVGIEVPIDNQIKTWTEATVPANWTSLRETWSYYHTVRTLTAITSVLLFVVGMLKRIP